MTSIVSPLHPERAAGERKIVSCVLDLDQAAEQLVAVERLPDLERDHPVEVGLGRAEAVDARDRRDHDHVAPGQQRVGRGVPQPLDLLVDRGVLLDVGVGLRDVRLGLVVVVVGDEVLDRVVRQQLAELVGELGGQRLVRRHHQRRALQPLDQPGGRGGLAGAGRAQQDDVGLPRPDPLLEVIDRGRLVTGRLEVRDDLERGDRPLEIVDGAHVSTVRRAPTTAAGGFLVPTRRECAEMVASEPAPATISAHSSPSTRRQRFRPQRRRNSCWPDGVNSDCRRAVNHGRTRVGSGTSPNAASASRTICPDLCSTSRAV